VGRHREDRLVERHLRGHSRGAIGEFGPDLYSMIPKSGNRFSEKIMLEQTDGMMTRREIIPL